MSNNTRAQQQTKYLVEAVGPEIQCTARELLKNRQYKYLLVNVLARRARELNKGERAEVDLTQAHTPTETALAEVELDQVKLVQKPKSKVLVSLIKNE
jgi:DNA-directed RNA polymerase omega subunit